MSTISTIYRRAGAAEEQIGYIGADRVIYKLRWGEGRPIGRVDEQGRIFRTTSHGERELGQTLENGVIHNHGLFEGGDMGWLDPDGVVVQAGLILGEEEVGRVDGPLASAAAAALLLLFLPDEAEAAHRLQQR